MRWPRHMLNVLLFVAAGTALAQPVPLTVERPRDGGAAAQSPGNVPPGTTASATRACLIDLQTLGLRADAAPPEARQLPGCGIEEPVRVTGLDLGSGRSVSFPDQPLLACRFAATLGAFTRDLLAPLTVSHLGAPLASLATGPGYECRGRNRQAGARLSAHSTGIAVDIGSIGLAGGRSIAVGRPRDDAERRFLAAVRMAACGWFTTVLGPGSDAAHEDHFHFDAIVRGSNGRGRLCE